MTNAAARTVINDARLINARTIWLPREVRRAENNAFRGISGRRWPGIHSSWQTLRCSTQQRLRWQPGLSLAGWSEFFRIGD